MTTEAQKIMQANREGVRFGAQEMRDRIVAELELFAVPEAIIALVERVEVAQHLKAA
ncbi:hypothetical protein LT85_0994 [Collimonas arenae]|uniref:Uncharacterized protein n=1 Tax=Collimonas arenae TaxID=279058 RepID=A0A0A1FBD5_9BURK|nr:hypothetical protein [Collimonas arenae]AIY40152.1 hypothetical protein LT85_0994 [Collimonas arenae]